MAATDKSLVFAVLAVGLLLTLGHCQDTNCDEDRFSFVVTGNTNDAGELVPEVTILNGSREGLEKTANITKEIVNGQNIVKIHTRVTFVIPPKDDFTLKRGFGYFKYQSNSILIEQMEQVCKTAKNGAHVAYPSSLQESLAIGSLARSDDKWLSVGLKRDPSDNTQYLRNGRDDLPIRIPDELWEDSEPDYSGNCIAMIPSTGKLQDLNCHGPLPFVCKQPLAPENTVQKLEVGRTFKYHPEYKRADEVSQVCRTVDDNMLVSFPEDGLATEIAREMAVLIDMNEPYITTGIKRDATNIDTYKLLDNVTDTRPDLTGLWAVGEPNHDGDCVVFERATQKLLDHDCSELLPFICYFPIY